MEGPKTSSVVHSESAQVQTPTDGSTQPSALLKRTSSLVRLSMSLDGKAKVTTNDESSPSPPRVRPAPFVPKARGPAALQRSLSAAGVAEEDKQCLPWPRRTISGRSRDARTWEFYCDSEVRDSLTTQAEREGSGSALGAIALIRARNSKTLMTNVNKRNLQASKAEPIKRIKASSDTQKPKLSRANSSMARLETNGAEVDKASQPSKQAGKAGRRYRACRSSSGDSDKENWEPGTTRTNARRRQRPAAQPNRQHAILQENLQVMSQSSSLDAVLSRENVSPQRSKQRSGGDVEEDAEVASFMAASGTPREEEDLDCVQGLLSLSQGAWH